MAVCLRFFEAMRVILAWISGWYILVNCELKILLQEITGNMARMVHLLHFLNTFIGLRVWGEQNHKTS